MVEVLDVFVPTPPLTCALSPPGRCSTSSSSTGWPATTSRRSSPTSNFHVLGLTWARDNMRVPGCGAGLPCESIVR